MKRATKEQARAYAMTIEEAGHNTIERAHQLTATGRVLCMKGISTAEDWDSYLSAIAQERPWHHLPEPPDPDRDWQVWLKAELGLDRDRLQKILAGLLPGTNADSNAMARVQRFETEIQQPLHPGKAGNPTGANQHTRNPDPGKGSSTSGKWGNDADYLMARLLRVDPDVAEKIGKGKPYRSINHAAQELDIVAKRKRYELNPDVDVDHAADRIVDVLGADKAAELAAALTLRLASS